MPRPTGLLLASALVACAKPAPPPETPSDTRPTTAVIAHLPPADPCFEAIDLRDLLNRHAAGYGSETQLEALLPRRMSAAVEMQGSLGTQVSVYDRDRCATTVKLGGYTMRTGFDQRPWMLGPAGVVLHLEGDDAVGMRYGLWLEHRRYLSTIDPARDQVRCERSGGTARAIVSVRMPELGDPELTFVLSSAELVAASARAADGARQVQNITAWSAPVDGVRWPSAWVVMLDEPVFVKDARTETNVSCDGCLAEPADVFVPRWPTAGRVSVPLVQREGRLAVPVRVGSHETAAGLAASANLSFMQASAPFAAAFKPAVEAEATYAPERPVQIGVLEGVSLGLLGMPHLPVASVDTQRLETASQQPWLVLGSSLFGTGAVRIDYKASRLIVAPRADALHGDKARAIPLHHWDDKLIARLELDGHPRFLELQTGSAGGVTLTSDPARPNLHGTLGNGALSGCAAVVFDVPRRTLWLEPPCTGALSSAFAPPR